MAVAVNTSGSQTAVISTEHTLATVTTAGTYQLVVDAATMVNGDVLTLRLYGKARTTDTERLLYEASFTNIQGLPLKASLAVVSPHSTRATLLQSAGTGRAFPWAIYSL
jgi:hypothetical protein